jgi:putative addiction module killer protein
LNTILRTKQFDGWLANLKDLRGKARIIERIRTAERGNFGDCEPIGNGVSEIRIHFGPGYRVYFCRTGRATYVLLHGGNKRTQKSDIAKARLIAGRLTHD